MKITDKEVLKELKTVRCFDLEESLRTYPDDEVEGRSEMQMLADECSYILGNYAEYGHVFHEDLEWARMVLRVTNNGKHIPLWTSTLQPKYRPSDIQNARNVINEHKRLKNLMKRLNAKGYYGKWI